MIALVGREEMHHHIAEVHDDPAIAGLALFASFFAMLCADRFLNGISQGIQHAITGAGAENKIIGKRCNFLDIEQENVLALLFFESVDDSMCEFKRIQSSPH